nr:M64 family metallopeptidase [Actinoplanes atraurantiacus]
MALHELGHSAFGLADESEYFVGCGVDTDRDRHPAVEPGEPNVTVNTNRATLK